MLKNDFTNDSFSLCVVIPSFKVGRQLPKVLDNMIDEVDLIIVIDDCCPESSGVIAVQESDDKRIFLIAHNENLGVGGAVKSGYREALRRNIDIIVKIDGDGQMNPEEIPKLVSPLLNKKADYAKGNRFYTLESLKDMPKRRLFGNSILNFLSKFSTGYWSVSDPNNGFTAITSEALSNLELDLISDSFFFESDMLFRLYCNRAVVYDIPIKGFYGNEKSNLSILRVVPEFFLKHLRNIVKRFFYSYILRDTNVATIELPLGLSLLCFGLVTSITAWSTSSATGIASNPGTVMLSGLAILSGIQFILAFISYDVSNVPKRK